MNAAARLVFQSSRHDHITPLLHRLHWLRAPERIAYNLAVLAYQCVHGLAPAYLADALQPVAGLPGQLSLAIPPCWRTRVSMDWRRPTWRTLYGLSLDFLVDNACVHHRPRHWLYH